MVASITPSLWFVVVGLLVAAGGTLLLSLFTAVNSDGDRTLQAFTVLLVTVFVWTAGYGARLITPSIGGKLVWQYVLYIGVVGTPVAWVVFAMLYSGRTRYVNRFSTVGLLLVPATTLVVLTTNRFHGLFYRSVSIESIQQAPILTTTAGPLWWAHFAYSYSLVFVGIVLLVQFALTADSLYRAQTAAIVTAGLLPVGANAIFVFDVFQTALIDLTPLAFSLSTLALFGAVFYGRFIDLVPIAQDAVVRTLEDGLLVVDDDGQIISANAAAEHIVGTDGAPDEVVGSALAAVEPTLAAESESAVTTGSHGVERGFEASTVTHGDPEWFWVRKVDLSESTTKSGSVVTMTDITEKKRFERRLRKLQRTHQRLMVADDESRIAEIVLEATEEVFELPVTGIWRYSESDSVLEPLGMTETAHDVIGDQPTFEADDSLAWEAFESGELQTYTDLSERDDVQNRETPLESEILLPIGRWGLMASGSTSRTEFRNVDFDLIRLLGAAVESALDRAERERRIRHLQRRTSSLIRAGSTDEIASEAVETADEIFGLPLSGIHLLSDDESRLEGVAATGPGRDSFGAAPSYARDGGSPVEQSIWRVFESGDALVVDDIRDADIEVDDRPIRSVIVHSLDEHGVFITSSTEPNAFDQTDLALAELFAATVTAALDRVQRERQLRDRERELQRQNDRLEEFTSVVSHDLRSPLNQANIYLEMLAAEYDDDRIDSVTEATDRASEMVDGLLTLARQGQTVDEKSSESLETTVRDAWQTVPTPEATLTVEDALDTVPADHARLRQVFENLFRNAIEHGGASVTVRVGRLDGRTGVYVADDGPGVPDDLREDVFEHGYSTDGSGTGFGLAIVKRILDAHGWTVRVRASVGGGARFEIDWQSAASNGAGPVDDDDGSR